MKYPLTGHRGAGKLLHALLLGAAWLAGACVDARAAEPDAEPNGLHISGFGTLGVVHINAPAGKGLLRDSFERDNDGGTRADVDTRLGLQANYRASSEIELVGQVLGANRLASAPPSDFVTLAFAAWRPGDDITVRAGRLSNDYFPIADYRNVGFAYPFVRPPVETYGSIPYTLDGGDLTKAWHFDETVWKVRGIVGQSKSTYSQGQVITARPAGTLVVSRDDGNGLVIRVSVSRVRLHVDSAAAEPLLESLRAIAAQSNAGVASEAGALLSALTVDGRVATYGAVGANLDRGPWIGNVEIARYQGNNTSYTSAWALLGHRWGEFTGYAGLSATRSPTYRPPQWTAALTPLLGAAGAAQAQQLGVLAADAASQGQSSQRTVTLGVRWDFSDRMALKLQWDRIRVSAYGTRLWSTTSTDPINANVGSATLDFVF